MTKDAFLLWQQNEVTQMFMRELKESLKFTAEDEIAGATIESLAIGAITRKANMRTLEKVLKWKPEGVDE
jgi:hypothetical protein